MKFSTSHLWVKDDKDMAVVGISDFLTNQLSEIVSINIIEEGSSIAKEQEVGQVEATKSIIDILSPLSGEIIKINKDLMQNPDKLTTLKEDKRWIFEIKVSDKSEYDQLLEETEYSKLLSG